MPTLATTVDGLKLPNPFVIGSGPPGTNLNVIAKAFKEGWGAVIAKTISDAARPFSTHLLINTQLQLGDWPALKM